MSYLEVISEAIPIILLISLGYYLKSIGFISHKVVSEMKELVVNLSLPALLFLSFLEVNFVPKYLVIILVVLFSNLLMLAIGNGIEKLFDFDDPYFALLFGGFEVGMLGIPLFGAMYGVDKVKYMGVIDIGQELYVWFILLALLFKLRGEAKNIKELSLSFVTSPIIIAVFSGIALNSLGLEELILYNNQFGNGFLETIKLISQITIPVILMIIGYEMEFNFKNISLPLRIIGIRISILIPLALIINQFIFTQILDLNLFYKIALLAMFILPPPFIIPLFIKENERENYTYIYNTLSLGSITTLGLFLLISSIYGIN